MRCLTVVSAVAALGVAGAAHASTFSSLHFDLDGLVAQTSTGGAFDLNYSGDLLLSSNNAADLAGVFGDGLTLAGTFTGVLDSFAATVTIDNGDIVGGSFAIVLVGGETYSASITANSGEVRDTTGGVGSVREYFFEGLTFDGVFSSNTFGGLNVSNFVAGIPLAGELFEFGYTPDANGFDDAATMDIFVVVPTPLGVSLGLAGLAGIAARRRRSVG